MACDYPPIRFLRACLVLSLLVTPARAQDLVGLSLEDLMQVEVRLVSRKPDALLNSPAALYVLTADDLRRSGVFTLPDALRLVPGMHVAQFDASKWAITSRGFNDIFANKLLVLFDGRSVYNPLFSGVFWEAQDILLDDIERIEVVRGPGGSVWGANAVNGVINVVRRTAQPEGSRISVATGLGGWQSLAAMETSTGLSEDLAVRFSASTLQSGALTAPHTTADTDDWYVHRIGLRADWNGSASDLVVDAQIYDGETGQSFDYLTGINTRFTGPTRTPISGGHVLTRWTKSAADNEEWSVQFYYDLLDRRDDAIGGRIHTLDIDIQRRQAWGRHDVIWGGGLRRHRDRFMGSATLTLDPLARTLWLGSLFAQDDISLRGHSHLTLGMRLEHNDFTGFELQPSLRWRWTPSSSQTWWTSVSRAVRTPSRVDGDERFLGDVLPAGELYADSPPALVTLIGSDDFEAETLIAVDAGFRKRFEDDLFLDLALFHNWYDDIRTSEPQFPVPHPDQAGYLLVPVLSDNLLTATSWGTEVAVDAHRGPFRFRGGFTYTHLAMELDPASLNIGLDDAYEGGHPQILAFLRSSLQVSPKWQMDFVCRYTDELEGNDVDAHADLDLQTIFHLDDRTDIVLQGRNLLTGTKRFEYASQAFALLGTKVGRTVLLSLRRHL